jgi:carboxymethylenebutenolidase
MPGAEIELSTPDGPMSAYEVAPPDGSERRGAVLFLMDGMGFRRALFDMADRLASAGYRVLLPDLYHRLGKGIRFDPAWMVIPEKVAEIAKTIGSLTPDMVMSDVALCLDTLASRPDVDPARIGAIGYCMGGRNAFLAAARFPKRLRATASIHPGGIVTGDERSPHLLARAIEARMYFGIAKDDRFFTREQADLFEAHLTKLGKRYALDHYGARHGWAVPDTPVHDPVEAERHWRAVLSLFASELGAG